MIENDLTRHLKPAVSVAGSIPSASYYEKSWALVIGIDDYGGEHPLLANAVHDAQAIADLLENTYGFDKVFRLFDREASQDAILEWLRDRLPAMVGSDDRLVIFFAGHGTTRASRQGEHFGYLVPQDAKQGKYADYVDMVEMRNACGWIPAKNIFVILDCCFSGIAAVTARAAPPASPKTINDVYLQRITQRKAWQVLTAGANDELALDSGWRRGG